MLRQSLLLAAVALVAGSTGCTHCDTCDDFPVPCVGGNCGGPGGVNVAPVGGSFGVAGPGGRPAAYASAMPPGASATPFVAPGPAQDAAPAQPTDTAPAPTTNPAAEAPRGGVDPAGPNADPAQMPSPGDAAPSTPPTPPGPEETPGSGS